MNSLTFAWRNSKSGFSLSVLTLSREPVMKLSSARTRMPRASKASQRCEPMKPAPPETTARSLVAADTPIGETQLAHHHGIVDVASIHDHRPAHGCFEPPQVEMPKLVPLGDHDQSVGAGRQTVCVARVFDLRQPDSRAFHRSWVVRAHVRPSGE